MLFFSASLTLAKQCTEPQQLKGRNFVLISVGLDANSPTPPSQLHHRFAVCDPTDVALCPSSSMYSMGICVKNLKRQVFISLQFQIYTVPSWLSISVPLQQQKVNMNSICFLKLHYLATDV